MQRKLLRMSTLATATIIVVAAVAFSLVLKCETLQARPRWLSHLTGPIERIANRGSSKAQDAGDALNHPFPASTDQWHRWLNRMRGRPTVDAHGRTSIVDELGGAIEVVAPLAHRPKNFNVEVAVIWNDDAKDGSCSLMLGVSDEVRYAFTVMPSGRTAVAVVGTDRNGQPDYKPVSSARFTPATLRSRRDALIVKVRGEKLSFFLNGQRVAEIADTLMADDWMLGVLVQGHQNVLLDKLIAEAR